MNDLKSYVERAAKPGLAAQEVEADIWRRVLLLGHQVLDLLFHLVGSGDVGESSALPDGREVRRLEGLHPRVYQSVFGAFEVERPVYGSREGQKIEYVPVDPQLARAAGIPTSTLRYYERVGLVCPTGRADNNYRVYTRDMLQRIHFIRAAQATGLTLDDVRTLLALHDGEMALCQEVQPLIARRLGEVSQRLEEMRHIQRILTSMLAQGHEQEPDALCHVVNQFSAKSR